jgi:hypothetical protein
MAATIAAMATTTMTSSSVNPFARIAGSPSKPRARPPGAQPPGIAARPGRRAAAARRQAKSFRNKLHVGGRHTGAARRPISAGPDA